MTVFQYQKKALQEIKNKPRREQWAYFWEYYKWYAVAALTILAVLIYGIVLLAAGKTTALGGMLIDGYTPEDEQKEAAYLASVSQSLNLDLRKEEIRFDTGISLMYHPEVSRVESFQRIQAGLLTKTTDFITAKTYAFQLCAYSTPGMFADLRDYLDADALTKLEGKIFYVDLHFAEQLAQTQVQEQLPAEIDYPDPTDPASMEEPIPVGIHIANCSNTFMDLYYGVYEDTWMGLTVSSQRSENVLRFLELLLDEPF